MLELKTVPFNIEMVIDINDAKEMHFIVNRKCILAYIKLSVQILYVYFRCTQALKQKGNQLQDILM